MKKKIVAVITMFMIVAITGDTIGASEIDMHTEWQREAVSTGYFEILLPEEINQDEFESNMEKALENSFEISIPKTENAKIHFIEAEPSAKHESVNVEAAQMKSAVMHIPSEIPIWAIVGIGLGMLLIIVILITLLVMKVADKGDGNKKSKKMRRQEEKEIQEKVDRIKQQEELKKQQGITGGMSGSLSGNFGETTLISACSQDTVLLQPIEKKIPYLIREKTGEEIAIVKSEFSIGKDAMRVDYGLMGNTAISREHVVIYWDGMNSTVEDKKTTNGTYINNVRMEPYVQMPLKVGDVLRMADEDFIYDIRTGM